MFVNAGQVIQKRSSTFLIFLIISVLVLFSIIILNYWTLNLTPEPGIPTENTPTRIGTASPVFGLNEPLFGVNPCENNFTEPESQCTRQMYMTTGMLTAVSPLGRLGNQMSAYAVLYAIGAANQRRAYMSPRMSHFISKYFDSVSLPTVDEPLFNNISWTLNLLPTTLPIDIRANIISSTPSGPMANIKFCCYPHSSPYFTKYRSHLLEDFKFRPQVHRHAEGILRRAKEIFYPDLPMSEVTYVGVQVRRGDYVERANNQSYGIRLPTIEFYYEAMEYLKVKVKNPVYILTSNDIEWCRSNYTTLSSYFNVHYVTGISEQDGGLDMATLSNCDHVIFGLGSFGFWAGFLNPGKVIYCMDCLLNADRYGGYENYVLSTWIGIPWNGTKKAN